MAIMIPRKPYDFTPSSLEDVMFDALENLPEDYYVFHSFQIAMDGTYEDETRTIREADFIVFNPAKGIICLEAKAGHIRYQEGEWLYSSGKVMKHNGPFKQAKSYMWELSDLIKRKRGELFEKNCKFYHAVWFPSVSSFELGQLTLPVDAPKAIIMTKDDLADPLPAIERIYDYNLCHGKKMALNDAEVRTLITKIFCPEFNIVPTAGYEKDLKKLSFSRLLKEQANILNFLVDQRSAIINGAAGTGKTMIALAKAQKHARQGESVLFLCYNAKLKNHLATEYAEDNIYFYTIDGLACKLCNTAVADYKKLGAKLDDMYLDGGFPYKHIVIDEGQDFGKDGLEEVKIIQMLHDIIMDRDDTGTFYIFYDKLQMVAAKKLPGYIADADCKMTLYRNCRNTENIAKTSLKPISERTPKLMEGGLVGEPAIVHFCSAGATVSSLDNTLAALKNEKYSDIVILTAKTLEKSAIKQFLQGPDGQEKYRGKIPVATCRTFKGLEADAIILIDVDSETFEGDAAMLFYVGTSRARLRLDIITDMDDEQCRYVLLNDLNYTARIKNAKKSMASALSAIGVVETQDE